MFWVILTAVVFLALAILCEEYGVLYFGVLVALGVVTVQLATATWVDPYPHENEYQLAQLNDTAYSSTEGVIGGGVFVTVGYVGTSLKAGYTYYRVIGDEYTLQTVEADHAVVKYTTETPKIVERQWLCEYRIKWDFWGGFSRCDNRATEYILYVPEGTVVHNYSLDGR